MPGTGCEQHPAPTAAVKGVGGGLTAAAAAARSHLPPQHRHRSRGRRRRCAGRQRRAPSGAWDTRAARCQEATLDKALHDSTGIHDVGNCQGVHPHGSTRDRAMDADGVQRLCNRATATSHSAPKLVEHSPQEARSRKHDGCRPTEQTANPLYQPRAAEHRGAAAQSALQCDPECQHGAMKRRGPYVDLDTGSASYAAAVHRMLDCPGLRSAKTSCHPHGGATTPTTNAEHPQAQKKRSHPQTATAEQPFVKPERQRHLSTNRSWRDNRP